MATYKGTHGTKIQNYTSDPANPLTGQVWYNATTQTLKVDTGALVGAWSTGGSLNTARGYLTGTGIQTAALAIGNGYPGQGSEVESYNGTNWTAVNSLNTAGGGLGTGGTTTSALAFGGLTPSAPHNRTELWNGTNWTEVNNLNTGRSYLSGCGASNTNALAFGGNAPVADSAITETWNGTNWTEVNDLNT